MNLVDVRQLSHSHGARFVIDRFSRRCITWRRYGKNGELRRPMVHRFEVKGGDKLSVLLVANLTANNQFFKRLCSR